MWISSYSALSAFLNFIYCLKAVKAMSDTPFAAHLELQEGTGVEHAVECGFYELNSPCLVVAVGHRLEVYRISSVSVSTLSVKVGVWA